MTIYTDGACKENSRNEDGVAEGKGGWGFIILENVPGYDMEIIGEGSGHNGATTNQEMEIVAVAEAFEAINGNPKSIDLYSDSAYVINCLRDRWYDKWRANGWMSSKKEPVKNQEAWDRMITLIESYNVNFFHVNRNSTKFIKLVDAKAKAASRGGELLAKEPT